MKMNKKVLLTIGGGILGLGIAFGGGVIATKATTDWQTNAINSANANLGQAADSETTKLTNSASTDINSKVQDQLNSEVQSQQAELQNLLDQYYQDKLNGLQDTAQFKSLEAEITQIKENILARYKENIDQVFAAQGAQ